jgi:hypothetical protein
MDHGPGRGAGGSMPGLSLGIGQGIAADVASAHGFAQELETGQAAREPP